MHGKGSLAVLLLVAALAVPPALYFRAWQADVPITEEAAPVVVRAEPVQITAPPPIKTAPPQAIHEVVVIERDPMVSRADREQMRSTLPKLPLILVADPPAPKRRPERLSVQGIVSMEGQERKAIVNGRETSVGESVGRARVLSIELDGVTFRSRGRTFRKRVGD